MNKLKIKNYELSVNEVWPFTYGNYLRTANNEGFALFCQLAKIVD